MNISSNQEFWAEFQAISQKKLESDPAYQDSLYQRAAQNPAFLPAVLEDLKSSDEAIRTRAFSALSNLGEKTATPEILKTLAGLLRDEDWSVRRHAARALGIIGKGAGTPEVIAGLLETTRDTNASTRQWATAALGSFARDNNNVRQVLRHLAASDPSTSVQAEARGILEETRTFLELVAEALREPVDKAASWLATTLPLQTDPISRLDRAEGNTAHRETATEARGEVDHFTYRILLEKDTGKRELIVATEDEEQFNQVVLIRLQHKEMIDVGMVLPPVYILLKQLGLHASGKLLLAAEAGEPTRILPVTPEDFSLDWTGQLRRSWQTQIRAFPEYAPLWETWLDQLPEAIKNRIKEA